MALNAPRASRDIQFLWSDTYRASNKPLVPPGGAENDLDRFGITQCEVPNNPFGFPFTDIRMVYDYFNVPISGFRPSLYEPDPALTGFRVSALGDPQEENEHADVYIWLMGQDNIGGIGSTHYPSYPADWTVFAEDSVTLFDPTTYHKNSIDLFGPTLAQVGDTNDSTRWTRHGSIQNGAFNHEFQHSVNTDQFGLFGYLHMFSSAADVIGGIAKDPPTFDTPFTWNLVRLDSQGGNYQAWQSFSAYLAFNFRGADTTFSVRSDDLLWRWAHKPERNIGSLAPALSDAECAECQTPAKSYLAGLSPTDRLQLVLHHWRVACFVNKTSLAQGQFGYPPQFGFDPIRDVGYWKNLDPGAADTVNIPLEVRLNTAQITRDLSQAGHASPLNISNAHVMAFETIGADYWVVRSAPSLWNANHDLVVRLSPEGFCGNDKLMLSAITYSQQDMNGQPDSLWKHPEWATSVIGPASSTWVPFSGNNQRLELVVPGFGLTHKAVVVVATSGHGSASYSTPQIAYRLNLGLRTGVFMSPNPLPLQTETTFDGSPTWSPSGNEVAFERTVSGSPTQIYRKPLDGSLATPLTPQSYAQFTPDWSPRGDWIAFAREDTGTHLCQILAFNINTSELRQISPITANHEFDPAFSPNGQRLVYSQFHGDVQESMSELHRVDLTGGNDTVLVRRVWVLTGGIGMSSPRWSPDGKWIYFLAGDSLYAVGAEGANRGNVVARPGLLRNASRFDLPLGSGRFLVEKRQLSVCAGITSRAVAADTLQGVDETLFFHTGAEMGGPRWSFDNTRVAYATKQNGPGTSDVYVGQVSYNHPPSMAGPVEDTQWCEAFPVAFGLGGSDPDGEPVSYQAVNLPPGATLSPNGYFQWPYPSPAGAEYYVVFRALDPSGGVDNRVVRYTVGVCEERAHLAQAATSEIPAHFALRQNQPNPFANSTTIAFDLPVAAAVRLEIFDLLGRRIRTLAEGDHPAGYHHVEWDRRGADGDAVSPGVYVYRLSAGAFIERRKMVLLP